MAKWAKERKRDKRARVHSYNYIKLKDRRELNLGKYAQSAAAEIRWSQLAKKEGFPVSAYLNKIRSTTDYRLLSQLARALPSFKGFGGKPLTGFQRNVISAAGEQRLRELGYLGTQSLNKESPT